MPERFDKGTLLQQNGATNMSKIREIMNDLPTRFDPKVGAGMNAVIQFDLSNAEDGDSYHAVIQDGRCDVVEGRHSSPSMTLKMTANDYIDLATGKLGHQLAFMTGRLRINGDLTLAMKLRQLLGLG